MKIAYLTNQYPRVSHTFVRREIQALEGLGLNVERYAVRRPPETLHDPLDIAEERLTRRILDVGATGLAAAVGRVAARRPAAFARAAGLATSLGLRADHGGSKQVAYLAEACVLLEWSQADEVAHIHAHFGTNSATLALLCHQLGGPSYSFTSHGPEEYDHPVALGLPEKIKHAKFAIAISHFGRSQLMRWCPAQQWHKLHVVRCGVDRSWLLGTTPPNAGSTRLLNIGRLSEQKGQVLLVEAAAILARDHEFELRLVGDGELRPVLERRIAELELQQRVKLLGWADSDLIRKELDACRAMVLPSFAEGLPVVIMEALARERPVVSTYVAGIPELVDDGCGWLTPAGSVEQLVAALKAALTASESELRAKGKVGRQRVESEHDVQRNAARLAELFRE